MLHCHVTCSPEQYQTSTKRRQQNITYRKWAPFSVQYRIQSTRVIKKTHWENKTDGNQR